MEEFLLVEKRELFAAAWDSLRGPVTKLQKANVGTWLINSATDPDPGNQNARMDFK
jgi:hypothetical protein